MTWEQTIDPAQPNKETPFVEMLRGVGWASLFSQCFEGVNATSGLDFGYNGGPMPVDGVITTIADGKTTLAASSTNYVECTRAGVVSNNTTGFTAGRVPLYIVVTSASGITTGGATDCRIWQDLPGIHGRASVAVTGADVTLSAAEARCDIINVTGLLTGNRALIVPNGPQQWAVFNNTTGAFSLTVKTAAGTGKVITQGKSADLVADGTNVEFSNNDVAAIGGALQVANNLSDVSSAAASRTNLGLGTAAVLDSDNDPTLAADSSTRLATQAAIKAYIATSLNARKFKGEPVRAKTAAALAANTYANGTAGVGATLTGNANGALAAQDGVTLIAGESLLVANEAAGANNGIYTVTQVGSGGAPYILTRRTDADVAAELVNATVYISEGTGAADQQWTCTTNAPITVGTTALVFAQTGSGASGVTSVDANGGVQVAAGSPITSTGTIRGAHVINAQTGTSYAVVAGDRGAHVTLSNAASIAATIAQAGTTGFEDGYFTVLENLGAGAVTLTPTTSTINGAATLVLCSGMSAVVYSDGTNYRAVVSERPGIPVNAQTGTSYTYLSGDRHQLVTHTNASAIAGTLPQATGAFGAGWHMWVENRGSGTLTITPTTSTIDGAASLALTTNQGCLVISDGTNYYTMRGVGGSGSAASKFVALLTPNTYSPPAATFALWDTRNSFPILKFDASTDWSALWQVVIPTTANLASGLLFRLVWAGGTATSGTTRWAVEVMRGNTDMDADSFATAATAGGTANGTSGIPTSTDITNTSLDGAAAGELVVFRISRDADGTSGTDDMTGYADLFAVLVETVA